MRTFTYKRVAFAALLCAVLASASAGCARDQAQVQVAQSSVQRGTSDGVGGTDLRQLVAGNSAFAFDLYQALREEDGNLFFSPYSVSAALAMTYAGARSETEREMAQTLHFTLPQERLHPAFYALDTQLVRPDEDAFKLHIANAIWGQTGYEFLAVFLDVLAQNYGAGLKLLDFESAPEPSRQVINDWVSAQTEERIKNLIPQGGIAPNTTLVLANAIYFDADWMNPFASAKTRDGTFTTLDGGQVVVPLMTLARPKSLRYAQGQGIQAVELPYRGEVMSMVILVPDASEFEAFEIGLEAARVEEILAQLESRQVALTMPKFTYESEFSLARALAEMGMPSAFGPADFSGMDGTRNFFISDVFHKAFVAVDEAGTEAAAATAAVMEASALPRVDIELTIDRPFIFIIRDVRTGTVVFVGRVLDPRG